MTVRPTEIWVVTGQVVALVHAARMPPTPREETKSVPPTIRNGEACVALRCGPLPDVANGTSDSLTSALVPATSCTLTLTASRCPRAWLSNDRPLEVSLKNTRPVLLAPIRSLPVVAIVLRPANTVVTTWQVTPR